MAVELPPENPLHASDDVRRLWDVLLETFQPLGFDDPHSVLDKVEEQFSGNPDLSEMKKRD